VRAQERVQRGVDAAGALRDGQGERGELDTFEVAGRVLIKGGRLVRLWT